uniref:Uncharacterized protein n=1 Tax=Arundo donax TaxID=35708 RepID=A0A0A9C687_ARUDO
MRACGSGWHSCRCWRRRGRGGDFGRGDGDLAARSEGDSRGRCGNEASWSGKTEMRAAAGIRRALPELVDGGGVAGWRRWRRDFAGTEARGRAAA